MAVGDVRFIGLPRPALRAVLAEGAEWRLYGERIRERAKRLCPEGQGSGPHLKDSLVARFIGGVDPRILIGSTMTVGKERLSLLALVEDGTDPHDIWSHQDHNLLAFQSGGDMVFVNTSNSPVHHPGTKKNPFIEQAMREITLEAIA